MAKARKSALGSEPEIAGFEAGQDGQVPQIGGGHGSLVRDGVRVFYRALNRRLSRFDIGVQQWFVLRALWAKDGQTQVELSRMLSIESAGLTAKLDVMEREALIERRRNPEDRRKINVFLTAKAWKLREALFDCAVEVNAIAERGLDPADIATAHRTIRAMLKNIEDADQAAARTARAAPARKRAGA